MRIASVVPILVGLFACTPPVAPSPDASDAQALGDARPDGGVCSAVCAHLAALGCAEGTDPKCVTACTLNLASPVTVDPLSCWANAATKEAARACGSANTGHLQCE